jgi:hypothetical protein
LLAEFALALFSAATAAAATLAAANWTSCFFIAGCLLSAFAAFALAAAVELVACLAAGAHARTEPVRFCGCARLYGKDAPEMHMKAGQQAMSSTAAVRLSALVIRCDVK